MQTFSGRRFWPLAPRVEDIHLEDVAHGLAMTCRYGGHTRFFYSVAEHCLIVSRYVPAELALEGLLHDTSEAWLGDMVRPLKYQDAMIEFRKAEKEIERCVAEKFGLRTDATAHAAVKEIDDRILVDEIQALMRDPSLYLQTGGSGSSDDSLANIIPLGCRIDCLSPEDAEAAWLARYHELVSHAPAPVTAMQ